MEMSIEAMKTALEAMEELHRTGDTQVFDLCYAPKVIPALRLAIEQAEKQEPVAWMVYTQDGQSAYVTDIPNIQKNQRALPLYTTPPQRQPLTDEEIREIAKGYALGLAFPYDGPTTPEMFARAIERKHGIGGNHAD
jgi:hypothetical protein